MIATGHRAKGLRALCWQDSPHEYRMRLKRSLCTGRCELWVRSMSDEGHKEQMSGWSWMDTSRTASFGLTLEMFYRFIHCKKKKIFSTS